MNMNCGMVKNRCSLILLHVGITTRHAIGRWVEGVLRRVCLLGRWMRNPGEGPGHIKVATPYSCSLLYRAYFFVAFT